MTFGSRRATNTPRNKALLCAGHVVAGVLLAAVLAMVFGWALALLWNHIMPDLLGTRPITYWQSVGLILMARILVGGFHRGAGHGYGGGHKARGEAWADYDLWWKEVGEKSFQGNAGGGPVRADEKKVQ